MTEKILAMGPGREFDLIRALVQRWGAHASGIGDDAAVLTVPRGDALVASVDTTIEGRHFRRGWLAAHEIGYRACAAALSDLAAMGARPLGMLIALAIPDQWSSDLGDIADGIAECARAANTPIVGGNTSAAAALSITTTVLGSAFAPLRRDGVRPGDTIYVTGVLGGVGAALRALEHGTHMPTAHRTRFARPVPRLAESRWLAEQGATAAVDISDGLAADLGHLAAASGVGIEVQLELVPVMQGVTAEQAVASGEEYEVVVSSAKPLDVDAFAGRFGLPLTRIGVARAGEPEVVLMQGGSRVANPAGYDHFSG